MIKIIHPVAGAVVILTIATFWLSTALSELFGSTATIVAVKSAIPWGFLLLVPTLAAAGGSGFVMTKGRRVGLIAAKIKRMPFIAANGILILIPAALFLASAAKRLSARPARNVAQWRSAAGGGCASDGQFFVTSCPTLPGGRHRRDRPVR